MLYLTDILRYPSGPRRVVDLAFDALDGDDYPAVQYGVVQAESGEWAGVRCRLCEGRWESCDAPERLPAHLSWLVRDVLDAMVLDLQNRRATRANDIALQDQDRLRIRGVEVGGRAVLRRLTGGRLGGRDADSLYDWRYVEFLRGDPRAVRTGARYRGKLVHLPPGDIAALCSAVPYLHAAELLSLLPPQLAAESLQVMDNPRLMQVFDELDETSALDLLNRMSPNRATDILLNLELPRLEHLLNHLPEPQRTRVLELLQYPSTHAGSLMTNDVLTAEPDITVRELREQVRSDAPRFVHQLYIVQNGRLLGTVPLKDVLPADDSTRLSSLMRGYTTAILCDAPAGEAAFEVIRSQLPALPVVGSGGKFLGAITADAATAQVLPTSVRGQLPRVFL